MSIFIDDAIKKSKALVEKSKLHEDTSIVNEAYFGKKPNVLKIERAFDSIFKKYCNPVRVEKIINCKEIEVIRECLKSEFGFKDIGFMINPTSVKNAGTVPLLICLSDPTIMERKKSIETSKEGIKFTKSAKMCFVIIFFAGIFDQNPDHGEPLTGGEMTAILLHEIGHNFTASLSKKYQKNAPFMPTMKTIGSILQVVTDVLTLNAKELFGDISMVFGSPKSQNELVEYIAKHYEKDMKKTIEKVKKENPEAYKEAMEGLVISMEKERKREKVKNTIRRTLFLPLLPLRTLQRLVHGMFNFLTRNLGYLDERFADNFASMYGYGPESISGLNKLTYGEVISYDETIPVLGHLTNIINMIPSIVTKAFDEHPNMPARYKNTVRELERELNSPNIDDKTKEIIRKQIKETDAIMDQSYKNFVKLSNIANPEIVFHVYDYVLCLFIGGDFRHMYQGTDIYDDIDDAVYGRGDDE